MSNIVIANNITYLFQEMFQEMIQDFRVQFQREFESERNRFYGDRFSRSDLKRELMEKMFHPSNMHKFDGWGFGLDD